MNIELLEINAGDWDMNCSNFKVSFHIYKFDKITLKLLRFM